MIFLLNKILLNKGLSTGMSDLGFPKGDVLVPRCGRYLNVQLFALQDFALSRTKTFTSPALFTKENAHAEKTM